MMRRMFGGFDSAEAEVATKKQARKCKPRLLNRSPALKVRGSIRGNLIDSIFIKFFGFSISVLRPVGFREGGVLEGFLKPFFQLPQYGCVFGIYNRNNEPNKGRLSSRIASSS
jgi:hypothetical protein